jgi:hypothetical protein
MEPCLACTPKLLPTVAFSVGRLFRREPVEGGTERDFVIKYLVGHFKLFTLGGGATVWRLGAPGQARPTS